MKADYDSQADALSIDLVEVDRWQGSVIIDDDYCFVALANGLPANIEVLYPRENLAVLKKAADHFGLDHEAIEVAAKAALAAPDRLVEIDLSARRQPVPLA